jgi:hypothetical protein
MFESILIQTLGGVIEMLSKTKLIQSKVSGDFGIGGGGRSLIKDREETVMYNMHMADFVMALTRTENNPKERFIKILKNRHDGKTGKVDPLTTINICAKMISLSIFGDRLKLFRVELEEAIKQTILEKIGDAHDPFRRESTGDGS